MGPLFNPFYWFIGLIICIAAFIVAVVAGILTHRIRSRHYERSQNRLQPPHWFITLMVAVTFGIVTFCGLGTWFFRDPSIPFFPPSRESIIGVWEMDAFSLKNMNRDGGYPISTHTITFHPDGTFEMINMPDWWLRGFRKSSNRFYSGTGTWHITQFLDYWVVWLDFSVLNGQPDRFGTSLTIGDWNGVRSIYYQLSEMSYLVSYKKR